MEPPVLQAQRDSHGLALEVADHGDASLTVDDGVLGPRRKASGIVGPYTTLRLEDVMVQGCRLLLHLAKASKTQADLAASKHLGVLLKGTWGSHEPTSWSSPSFMDSSA